MKRITTFFLATISAFVNGQTQLTTDELSGQLNTITTGVPFLLITPDAQAGGMGDAGCASTPNVFSNHWNASKYAFMENKNGIAFSWTPWLRALIADINLFDFYAYKKMGKKNVVAISGRYFSLGDISFTDIIGNIMGQFRPREYYVCLSYSRFLAKRFSVGMSAKYIHSNLTGWVTINGVETHPGRSFAGDISCFWKDTFQLDNISSIFSWGINISNVGKKVSYSDHGDKDFIPANLRIGASYKLNIDSRNSLELICDANKLLVPTPSPCDNTPLCFSPGKEKTVFYGLYSSFYDAPGGWKEELHEIMLASGIEYWYNRMLAIRTGYFYEHETKGGRKYLTFGIGGRYAGVGLDISYLLPTEKRHPLQNTVRFTFLCEFGKTNASARKKAPDFLG